MNKVLILGGGAFGSALGHYLINDVELSYFTKQPSISKNEYESNLRTKVEKDIKNIYYDINECFKNNSYDFIIIALPSNQIETVIKNISKFIFQETIIINSSKGMCENSSWYKLISESNKHFNYCAINGGSFASEMLENQKTMMNVFAKDFNTFNRINHIFNEEFLNLEFIENQFEVAEWVSSFKNAIAIGMGLTSRLSNSKNTINWIFTLALQETKLIIDSYLNTNVDLIQFFGIGDIFMCCTSNTSRNFNYGYEFIDCNQNNSCLTIEGIRTIKLINKICIENKIITKFFKVLFQATNNEINPKEFINNLWNEIKR